MKVISLSQRIALLWLTAISQRQNRHLSRGADDCPLLQHGQRYASNR